jgi:hypothetical protein
MAETEIDKAAEWKACSDEERQRIQCQTRMARETKYGYWSLYRYASALEVAAMVLCTSCAVGAGVVTPLMTVAMPTLPIQRCSIQLDPITVALNKSRLCSAISQVPLLESRPSRLRPSNINISSVAIHSILYTSVSCNPPLSARGYGSK